MSSEVALELFQSWIDEENEATEERTCEYLIKAMKEVRPSASFYLMN